MFKRKVVILWGLVIMHLVGFSQVVENELYVAGNVDSLIKYGQYERAFQSLCRQDPQFENTDLVIKKCEIALNYYLASSRHLAFSFVNLRRGEKLEQLRRSERGRTQPLIPFPIDSILYRQLEKEPNNYQLHRLLGDFFFKVYQDFGDNAGISAEELLERSKHYYLSAYQHGEYNYYSLYALGYYHTIFENYHESQQWFLKSLSEYPENSLAAYNLAVSYLFDGQFKEGVKYARQAYEQYTDSLKKGDAARITGILLFNSQKHNEALTFFKTANALSPYYRPNQLYLLRSLLHLNLDEEAYELAMQILIPTLHDPDIPDEYVELFLQQKKPQLLVRIFNQILSDYKADFEARGNIRFHYGKLLYKEGEVRKALRMFKKSRKEFEHVFTYDHPVFQALDQMISQIEERH